MNLFNKKYSRFTIYLFLMGYIFLFGYNILHYHNINALFNTSVTICEAQSGGFSKGHSVNLEFQCPIHNTYNSLHNVLINSSCSSSIFLKEIDLVSGNYCQFYFQKEFYLANALRAPPSLFS